MALTRGTRLGAYEIVGALGAGGMASLPPCLIGGGVMVAAERLTARQLAVQVWIEGLALDSS